MQDSPEQSSLDDSRIDRQDQNGAKGEINPDLVHQEMRQGVRVGDKYVRVVRPYSRLFQRVGPGYLLATEEVLEPRTPLRRLYLGLKHVLIGGPLPSHADMTERLDKLRALPIFASDAISSVAYATEEILFILALAGSAALAFALPISLIIAVLLFLVAFSYRQTVFAYPSGGGSYVVSKENIGTRAGLVAAAALMLDYVLTVSVSIASGTAALTSAFEALRPYRVPLELLFVSIMVVGNLRGIRESGNIFAAPTYLFIFGLTALILVGVFRVVTGQPPVEQVVMGGIEGSETTSLWLLLTAFSAGSVAMSGTEAISNGVPAFKPPESKNAAATLTIMASLLALFFLGIGYLAYYHGIATTEQETVLSQLGRAIFGKNYVYYLIQLATMAILILAANTSFNGFPRLASILAQDGFLPHQLAIRGDRLAFSYGIIILGMVASLLIIIFQGDTHALIPLYAVGVFLAFTMSQLGMIQHWRRLRTPGWKRSIAINVAGAAMCAIVLVIAILTKFIHGAWIIVILIPTLVVLFYLIHRHYATVEQELLLKVNGNGHKLGNIRQIVIVPLSELNLASARALEFAHSISSVVHVVHVAQSEEQVAVLRDKLRRFDPDSRLVVLESPYRATLDPLLSYIDALHGQDREAFITVIVPEFLTAHWWQRFLHNGTADQLNRALRPHPNIAVVNVPYVLHH
ncbi:MAG: APC family permease [Anaerolineae bacterium]